EAKTGLFKYIRCLVKWKLCGQDFFNYVIPAEELTWGFWGSEDDISNDENFRTLFLTFARCFSVTEAQVWRIFSLLVDCNSISE
ncbi:hypothetical protein Ddye_007275, partial [Dipteronia dyeriana]